MSVAKPCLFVCKPCADARYDELQVLVSANRDSEEDYVNVSRAISLRRRAVESCMQFALHCLQGTGRQLPPGLKIVRAKASGKAKAAAKGNPTAKAKPKAKKAASEK